MNEREDYPLSVYWCNDPHADETDFEPYIKEYETTLSQTFSERQREILDELMGRKGLTLKRFKVNAVTTKSGFFEYHYSSGVRMAGWDQENRFQEVFYKGSEQQKEYYRWQNPSAWIEESDLGEKEEGK